MSTPPLLPSAVAAIEAAVSADALAMKAKEEYLMILKLKKIWEGLTFLLGDPIFNSLRQHDTNNMPTHLKTLVLAFSTVQAHFKQIEEEGVSTILQALYDEVTSNPLLREDLIVEDSLAGIQNHLEVVSTEFVKREECIYDQLRTMNESLAKVTSMVRNYRINSDNKLLLCNQGAEPQEMLKRCALLLDGVWSVPTRVHALESMKGLVSGRWGELSSSHQNEAILIAKKLLCEVAGPLKVPILTYISEIFDQLDLALWKEVPLALISTEAGGPGYDEAMGIISEQLTRASQGHYFDMILN